MWIQDILKIFFEIITGEYFKFYTVVKFNYGASARWGVGSDPSAISDTEYITNQGRPDIAVTNLVLSTTPDRRISTDQYKTLLDPASIGSTGSIQDSSRFKDLRNDWTALNNSGTVDTLQIYPEVEFEYTYWYYQTDPDALALLPLNAVYLGGPIFYLTLDPLIKGKNVTVTNSIYVDERVVPQFPSATDPLVYWNGTSGGEGLSRNSFGSKTDWTVDEFLSDTSYTSPQGDNIIYPFWMFRNDPRKDGMDDKIVDADKLPRGRSIRTFKTLNEYIGFFSGYDTSDADFVSKNTQYNSIIEEALGYPSGGVIHSAKATISGYYTHDELFPDVNAKYVPIGQSDLSTPNISLGGNQVNYSGVLSGIPQGQEVYEIKPDATGQVLLPVRIQSRQDWPIINIAFELGGTDYRYDDGLRGPVPYRTDRGFTSFQDYEDNAFQSGSLFTHTQDYSKTGTFTSDYFNSSEYKDGIRTSSLQQTTTETEGGDDAGGY